MACFKVLEPLVLVAISFPSIPHVTLRPHMPEPGSFMRTFSASVVYVGSGKVFFIIGRKSATARGNYILYAMTYY